MLVVKRAMSSSSSSSSSASSASSFAATCSALGKRIGWSGCFCLLVAAAGVVLAVYPPDPGRLAWEVLLPKVVRKIGFVTIGLAAVLLFTRGCWCRRPVASHVPVPEPPLAGSRWHVPAWPVCLAATMLLALLVRLPLASNSMWWDELWNVRYTIAGEFRGSTKAPDDVKFRPVSYKRTLWFYNKPANHPPVSLLARVSHEIWQKATKAPEGAFSELVLRLPVLAFGLAGIATVACFLRRLGNPLAGILAAILLALHPWAIRYGVDLRGYAVLLFTAPVCLWASMELWLGDRRWKWWLLLAFSWTLSLWAHPWALWFCAGSGGALLWKFFQEKRSGSTEHTQRWNALFRLLGMATVSFAIWLPLFGPCLAQVSLWGERNQDPQKLTLDAAAEVFLKVFAGSSSCGSGVHGTQPVVYTWALAVLLCGAAAWGWRHLRAPRGIAVGMLVSFLLALGVVVATGAFFYDRLVIALCPVAVVFLAWGLSCLVGRARYLGTLLLGLFLWHGLAPVQQLRQKPLAPWRQIASYLRTLGPHLAVFGIGHGREALQLYLPQAVEVAEDSPEALQKRLLEHKAARPNALIRLVVGNPELHERIYPKTMAWLKTQRVEAELSLADINGVRYVVWQWLP